LAVTTTPKAWPQNRRWTAASAYVHAAVGLHPELVAQRHHEIALLEEYIGESRLVGEIGLDGSPQHRKSWEAQTGVFLRALKRAQELGGRIVSIHSRRAADEVIKLLAVHTTPDRVLPILHWFSGSASAARNAASQGCYFSVNHRMLEHDAGLALVRSLPLDRLLTETDAPFTSQDERPSRPSDTLTTARQIAAVRGLDAAELHQVLSSNARHVLGFAGVRQETDGRS
jgi:TatD DNase family protein